MCLTRESLYKRSDDAIARSLIEPLGISVSPLHEDQFDLSRWKLRITWADQINFVQL